MNVRDLKTKTIYIANAFAPYYRRIENIIYITDINKDPNYHDEYYVSYSMHYTMNDVRYAYNQSMPGHLPWEINTLKDNVEQNDLNDFIKSYFDNKIFE